MSQRAGISEHLHAFPVPLKHVDYFERTLIESVGVNLEDDYIQ